MFDGKIKVIVTKYKIYSPEDNALIFIIDAAHDTQFSRDLSKIVKDRIQQKAKHGGYLGRVPIGCRNVKESEFGDLNVVIVDDKRYPLTRQMWDMALTGQYTVSQIACIADKEWGGYVLLLGRRVVIRLYRYRVYMLYSKIRSIWKLSDIATYTMSTASTLSWSLEKSSSI